MQHDASDAKGLAENLRLLGIKETSCMSLEQRTYVELVKIVRKTKKPSGSKAISLVINTRRDNVNAAMHRLLEKKMVYRRGQGMFVPNVKEYGDDGKAKKKKV